MTPTAVMNVELIRRAEPTVSITALAKALGRDRSNTARAAKILVAEEFLVQDGYFVRRTEKGDRFLDAIEIAEGRALPGRATPVEGAGDVAPYSAPAPAFTTPSFTIHSKLRPNPDNPREHFDAEEDAGFADTVEAKGVLQNVLTTAADADGVRMLYAGERRWRAVGALIAAGRVGTDFPIPFVELALDAAGEAESPELIALIENGQRANLTPLEEARAYRILIAATGWSQAEAARRTGKNPRVVQEGQRVLEKASPEAIERHARGEITWEALRMAVRESAPAPTAEALTPKMALAMAETAHFIALTRQLSEREWRAHLAGAPPPGGAVRTLVMKGFMGLNHFRGDVEVILHDSAIAWLRADGYDADPEAYLLRVRTAVLGETRAAALAGGSGYAATWLVAPTKPPTRRDTERDAAAARAKPAPGPAGDLLTHRELLALLEIEQAVELHGVEIAADGQEGVPTVKHWLAQLVSDLVAKRLVAFVNPQDPPGWHVALTDAGIEAIEAHRGDCDFDIFLARAREAAGHPDWPGPGYVTDWLNAEPVEARPLEADAEDAEIADELGDLTDEAIEVAADEIDQLVRTGEGNVKGALELLGFSGPFDAGVNSLRPIAGQIYDSNGLVVASTCNINIPHDAADALAKLLAWALNRCADRPELPGAIGAEAREAAGDTRQIAEPLTEAQRNQILLLTKLCLEDRDSAVNVHRRRPGRSNPRAAVRKLGLSRPPEIGSD